MNKQETLDLLRVGRFLFSLALIGFGTEHFIFGTFVSGRAPSWPADLPGEVSWVYISGAVFIIAGLYSILGKNARVLLITSGVVVFIWALCRHLFIILPNLQWGGELTNAGKALTLFGGLLSLAAIMPPVSTGSRSISVLLNQKESFLLVGRICMATFLIIAGIEHFIFIQFVKTLVPSWIPASDFWSYFTGVALVAGGIGLLITRFLSLAGMLSGIMIFIWFLILHIPRAINAPADNVANEWVAVCESLAFSAIAFVFAGKKPKAEIA